MKQDNLVTSVIGKFFQRSELGQRTYGTTLEEFQPNVQVKLRYLQEELLDGALYIEWAIQNLEQLEDVKQELEEEKMFNRELLDILLKDFVIDDPRRKEEIYTGQSQGGY